MCVLHDMEEVQVSGRYCEGKRLTFLEVLRIQCVGFNSDF